MLKLVAFAALLVVIVHKVLQSRAPDSPVYAQLNSLLGPLYTKLTDSGKPVVSTRPALAVGLLLFFIAVCCGGIGEDSTSMTASSGGGVSGGESDAANTEPPPPPPPPTTKTVKVSCQHVDRNFQVECGIDEECMPEGSEMICPQHLTDFYPTEEKVVNNWEKDGHWASMKDKLTVFALDISTAEEVRLHHELVGKPKPSPEDNFVPVDAIKAYNRSAIIIFGEVPGLTSQKGMTYGLAYFRSYSQGFIQDDMYMQAVQLLSKEEYDNIQVTATLAKASKDFKGGRLKNTRLDGEPEEQFLDVVSLAVASIGEPMTRTLIRVDQHAYEEVTEKGEAAKVRRNEKATPKLEANPYLRLTEIGFEWNDDFKEMFEEGQWTLPTSSRCGKNPPGDDDAEKAESAANKDYYKEQLLNRYFVVPLRVEEAGDFDENKKGFPIDVSIASYEMPFSLSGKVKIDKEAITNDQCCDIFGNCESRLFGCKPGERLKTFFIGNSYSFNEDTEKRSLLIKDEAEVPSKPLGVEGTAVIQVQKVTRVCVKDELESPRYTGVVAGIELTDDGKVLLTEINKEIPVEEALKGRDTWLREKLSP